MAEMSLTKTDYDVGAAELFKIKTLFFTFQMNEYKSLEWQIIVNGITCIT
jgi:hypothetical protein